MPDQQHTAASLLCPVQLAWHSCQYRPATAWHFAAVVPISSISETKLVSSGGQIGWIQRQLAKIFPFGMCGICNETAWSSLITVQNHCALPSMQAIIINHLDFRELAGGRKSVHYAHVVHILSSDSGTLSFQTARDSEHLVMRSAPKVKISRHLYVHGSLCRCNMPTFSSKFSYLCHHSQSIS